VERVDVTQFFSDATQELLQRAAQTAVEWGSLGLDSDHLLYAALQDDVVRHVLRQTDADPEAIAAEIDEEAEKASRTTSLPRSPGTRRLRFWRPTTSRVSSARRTSVPNTFCWKVRPRRFERPSAISLNGTLVSLCCLN
jgi:ATP-dependent Clp protease ATP-binding subunit ClpA